MQTHPSPGRTPQTDEFTKKATASPSVEFHPTLDPMKTPRKGIVLRLSGVAVLFHLGGWPRLDEPAQLARIDNV